MTAVKITVPAALNRALQSKPTAKRVFHNMRPSCQVRYSSAVQRAKTAEERKKRVAIAVRGIIKYGNVHPRLKSKLYQKRTAS